MIHEKAEVSEKAKIGKKVKIWAFTRIREGVSIGNDCVIGGNVYVDHDVRIGSKVKIEDNCLIYFGSRIENEVFIGPAVCLIHDLYPRSTNRSGQLKTANDWKVGEIILKRGASIGAGTVILPGVKIGRFSMIGAGSVVTKSIGDFTLAYGNPAVVCGHVCKLGHKLEKSQKNYWCKICKKRYQILDE